MFAHPRSFLFIYSERRVYAGALVLGKNWVKKIVHGPTGVYLKYSSLYLNGILPPPSQINIPKLYKK